jgi:hypothetical protein
MPGAAVAILVQLSLPDVGDVADWAAQVLLLAMLCSHSGLHADAVVKQLSVVELCRMCLALILYNERSPSLMPGCLVLLLHVRAAAAMRLWQEQMLKSRQLVLAQQAKSAVQQANKAQREVTWQQLCVACSSSSSLCGAVVPAVVPASAAYVVLFAAPASCV